MFKNIFVFIFVALVAIACEEDNNPIAVEEHTDAEGFILEDENGVEVYKEFEGEIVANNLTLSVGETFELTVHFLDHDGNEIEHEEGEEEHEDELRITGNDAAIATIEVEDHEEEGDEDEEEHHEMAIHIVGVSAGTTSFKLELMHEGHADYTSTNNVSITVTNAGTSNSRTIDNSNLFSCSNKLCLKACCARTLYAAK